MGGDTSPPMSVDWAHDDDDDRHKLENKKAMKVLVDR
jgi:hypothetical protein